MNKYASVDVGDADDAVVFCFGGTCWSAMSREVKLAPIAGGGKGAFPLW